MNLNPSSLTVTGLIKIYKPDCPIRPVVNWKSPSAWCISYRNCLLIPLPYIYNVKNIVLLIHLLKKIPFNNDTKFTSHDISNTYSSIPIAGTKTIMRYCRSRASSFFSWHYSPSWTLSSPKIVLHCSLSCDLRLQFLTSMFCRDPSTDPNHFSSGFREHA